MFVTCAPSQTPRLGTQLDIVLAAIATCVPMVSFGLTRDLLLSSLPVQSKGSENSGSNRFLYTIFTLLLTPSNDLILKTGMLPNGLSTTL